jgi:transcriptional regulator
MALTPPNEYWLRGTLELLLLQALRTGPLHGYAIARHIERVSEDALSVEEGSLYPALHRLEERGLVLAKWTKGDKGRRVRTYSLTAAGRRRLDAQKRDWSLFSRAIARMVDKP